MLTKAGIVRDAGLGLIITPAIFMIVPIYAAIKQPSIIAEMWDFYLLFVGFPWIAGFALLVWARKLRGSA